jgi:hypothetical protein
MTNELSPLALDNSRRSNLDILENRNVLAAKPQSLYMDVSNRCNIKCLTCLYHWNGQDMRKAEVMPKEVFFKVGRELFRDTLWLADAPAEPPLGRVRLAAKVLGAGGEVTVQDFVRFPLEADVAPGGTAVRQIYFELPEGAHGVLLDLVDEGIAWFESMGGRPVPLMLPASG